MDDSRYLTVNDAARRLRVAGETVRRLIVAGELEAVAVGLGRERRRWRIDAGELARFVERNSTSTIPVGGQTGETEDESKTTL